MKAGGGHACDLKFACSVLNICNRPLLPHSLPLPWGRLITHDDDAAAALSRVLRMYEIHIQRTDVVIRQFQVKPMSVCDIQSLPPWRLTNLFTVSGLGVFLDVPKPRCVCCIVLLEYLF